MTSGIAGPRLAPVSDFRSAASNFDGTRRSKRNDGHVGKGTGALGMTEPPTTVPEVITAVNVGPVLRALRELRGISQKELAARVGISSGQMSQIETGRYVPSLEALPAILAKLDARLEIALNEGGGFHPPESQLPPAREPPWMQRRRRRGRGRAP
jgi:DNA-binding XRE family transcriptional regulator